MLLHHRIIKCQVMPWQENTAAESQWRDGNGRWGGTSGGMAWWKCMLGRINGSSNTRMACCWNWAGVFAPFKHPPRLAMRWSSCFRWVCTVGHVYLGWSVDVCQAGVGAAKRKSAHFLLLQRKSQQSGSFKPRLTAKSPPGCSFHSVISLNMLLLCLKVTIRFDCGHQFRLYEHC